MRLLQLRWLTIFTGPRLPTLVSQPSFSRDGFDLEQLRPELSRNEKAVGRRVVSDAVQDSLGIKPVSRRHQTTQINPTKHSPRLRRSPRNSVRMPDVCVHLTANDSSSFTSRTGTPPSVTLTRLTSRNVSGSRKRSWSDTVAENEPPLIPSQAPTLASVSKGATHGKSRHVVNEGYVGAPSQLHELTVPFLKALGEIRRVHAVLLHDFTRFQLDLSQCRPAVTAGTSNKNPLR